MKTVLIRTILITGASSGIGAALAELYAGQGARLALTGRDAARLEAVAGLCRRKGTEVHILQCDILARDILQQWILSIDEKYGIDLVIANAGISAGTSGLPPAGIAAQSRHIFDVNLTGVLNTIEPVLPRMIARRRGQIALMSSMAGYLPLPGAPAYSASKAAVRFYGEALRLSLAVHQVQVNVICPGFVHTPLTGVNAFPMPFACNADRAAQRIADGLFKNKPVIAFPLTMSFALQLFSIMPKILLNRILLLLPKKNS